MALVKKHRQMEDGRMRVSKQMEEVLKYLSECKQGKKQYQIIRALYGRKTRFGKDIFPGVPRVIIIGNPGSRRTSMYRSLKVLWKHGLIENSTRTVTWMGGGYQRSDGLKISEKGRKVLESRGLNVDKISQDELSTLSKERKE